MEAPGSSQWMDPIEPEMEGGAVLLGRGPRCWMAAARKRSPQALMATAHPSCRSAHWGAISAQRVGHPVNVESIPSAGPCTSHFAGLQQTSLLPRRRLRRRHPGRGPSGVVNHRPPARETAGTVGVAVLLLAIGRCSAGCRRSGLAAYRPVRLISSAHSPDRKLAPITGSVVGAAFSDGIRSPHIARGRRIELHQCRGLSNVASEQFAPSLSLSGEDLDEEPHWFRLRRRDPNELGRSRAAPGGEHAPFGGFLGTRRDRHQPSGRRSGAGACVLRSLSLPSAAVRPPAAAAWYQTSA